MAQPVQDRLAARLAVEKVLRDQRVEADDRGERERQPVDDHRRERHPAHTHGFPRHTGDGGREQHLLPRLHGVEGIPAHAGVVEERHHEVVEREPDDEDVERHDRPHPDGDDADREQGDVDDEDEGGHACSRRRNTSRA